MNPILLGLIGKIVESAQTQQKKLAVSKTKVLTHTAGANAVVALLPAAVEGDALAIGQLVLAIVTWIGALCARGTKA